jgi:protein TilB
MPEITLQLIRKRAEHNERIITSLEELSLHQEEIESINEVLGSSCRKLKILYLQNNIIGKIENLLHMKELRYLNLALNNITRVEGLQNCEFLHKLDLTLNFIDFDTFKFSMDNLSNNLFLEELFMVGNPVQAKWEKRKYESYVIAKLPQLKYLDGTEVTKSMHLLARQSLSAMEVEFHFSLCPILTFFVADGVGGPVSALLGGKADKGDC